MFFLFSILFPYVLSTLASQQTTLISGILFISVYWFCPGVTSNLVHTPCNLIQNPAQLQLASGALLAAVWAVIRNVLCACQPFVGPTAPTCVPLFLHNQQQSKAMYHSTGLLVCMNVYRRAPCMQGLTTHKRCCPCHPQCTKQWQWAGVYHNQAHWHSGWGTAWQDAWQRCGMSRAGTVGFSDGCCVRQIVGGCQHKECMHMLYMGST